MGSRLRALQPDKLDPGCKMDSKLVFPLTILLLATLVHSGSGQEAEKKKVLKCYQCNSYEDALCADPFFHDELDQDGEQVAKSGDDFLDECPSDGKEYKFCRKIYLKNRCDHQTNLFDLRSCLQMRKFEVVHKPSGGPAFSPELLSTQSLGFCSATRL